MSVVSSVAGVVSWIPLAAVPDSMDLVAGAPVFGRASLGAVGAERGVPAVVMSCERGDRGT